MSTLNPDSTNDATAVGSTQLAGTSTNAGSEHIVSALKNGTVLTQVADLLSTPGGDRIRRIINANRDAAPARAGGSTRGSTGIDMPRRSPSDPTETPSESVPSGLAEGERVFSEAEMVPYCGIAQLCVRSLIDGVTRVSAAGVSNAPGMSIECVSIGLGDVNFELGFRTTGPDVKTFKAIFKIDMGQEETGAELVSVDLIPTLPMSPEAAEQQRLRDEQSQQAQQSQRERT